MRILAIFVIVCTLLSVGCEGEKSDYDAGIAAYKRGHYTAALYDFDKRANQGDPVAQFCLAFMYRNGKGVRANEDEAMYWYTESANQDYAPAQNNLAALHFQKAKNLQYRVIKRLGRGEEVTDQIKKKDDSLQDAMQWLQKAEKQNNRTAHYNIALTHYFDAVVFEEYAKNEDKFVSLLKDAEKLITENTIESEQDKHLETNRELLEYFKNASTNAKKAYAETVNWFAKAADYPQAQYELANRYYYAEGIDENLTETARWEKAIKWYTEAGDYAPAQNALAKMYAEGEGVEKDPTKAVELYKEAAKQNNADAQFNLAEMYVRGVGIDENLTKTEKWEEVVRLYTKAADQGHAAAQNNLAKVYTEGISIAEGKSIFKNPEKAARLYFRAAQQANPVAQANIGRNFETGLYNSENKRYEVPQNDEEAYYWYGLALRDPVKLDELATTKNFADKVAKWREGIGNKLEEKKNEIQKPVDNWKQKESNYSSGTGFYISKHYILTNEHVVRSADEFRTPYRRVELIAVDQDVDLALLYDKRGNTDTATFRNDPVYMEEKIVSFGYPVSDVLSYEGNRTEGTVSGRSGMLNMPHPDNYFQHTAPIQGGNSGGPVFDLMGNVIGVTKYVMISRVPIARIITIAPPQNVNFAIKFDVVKEFLRKNGFEEDLGSSIEKEQIYKVHYASTENLSNALNSKGAGVYKKAKRFTVPVLCFKNKEPESVLLHEISIEELVKTAKDIPNSNEDKARK